MTKKYLTDAHTTNKREFVKTFIIIGLLHMTKKLQKTIMQRPTVLP